MQAQVSGVQGLRARPHSPWREPLRNFFRNKPLGVFGLSLMVVLVFTGIFAPLIMPYGFGEINPRAVERPPSLHHLMGTDSLGRDVFSRVVYGARVSMFVGLGAVSIGIALGTLFGILSAWLGGRVDLIAQRFVDAVMAIPSLILLLTIVSVIGPGIVNIILALGLRNSISESRVMRSATLAVKEYEYVTGGRAIGAGTGRLLLVYILPNIFPSVIVVATVALGQVILAEASLSFLGFGVPPPTPSWGGMLSGEGRASMVVAPWLAIFPGLALSLAVFGINMLGDALRDVLDPRLRGGR